MFRVFVEEVDDIDEYAYETMHTLTIYDLGKGLFSLGHKARTGPEIALGKMVIAQEQSLLYIVQQAIDHLMYAESEHRARSKSLGHVYVEGDD